LLKNAIMNLRASILCARLLIPNGRTSVVGFYLDSDGLHHLTIAVVRISQKQQA
jgi:hypothetical protein